jgi:hypothetical protein
LPDGIEILATITTTPCWASSDPAKNCAILDYDWRYPPTNAQDYADFLSELVMRYHDRIRYWEIWNEPNLHFYWADPDPSAYTIILQAAYPVIKAVDADAIVIGGSLAPWDGTGEYPVDTLTYLDGMYQAGALGNFDMLSFHPYTDGNTPTWYDSHWPMHSFSHSVPAIHELMLARGDSSPIMLSEIGWTTVPAESCADCWTPTLPVTEEEQAAYLVEAVEIARDWEYVDSFIWYELFDMIEPPDPQFISFEHYFGLIRKDYTQKPSAYKFRDLVFPYSLFLPFASR